MKKNPILHHSNTPLLHLISVNMIVFTRDANRSGFILANHKLFITTTSIDFANMKSPSREASYSNLSDAQEHSSEAWKIRTRLKNILKAGTFGQSRNHMLKSARRFENNGNIRSPS